MNYMNLDQTIYASIVILIVGSIIIGFLLDALFNSGKDSKNKKSDHKDIK